MKRRINNENLKIYHNCYKTFQTERAFQKQPTIFQNKKKIDGAKKQTLKRYTKAVGLGFRMPLEVRCEVSNFKFALETLLFNLILSRQPNF